MQLASLAMVLLLASAPASQAKGPDPVQWPEHRETLQVLPPEQRDPDEAKRLFEAGRRAAEHARWDEAIRYFAEAYRLSGSAGQLYSLGRGHRELYFHHGRDPVQLQLALLRLRQYLDASPDGRNRDNAARYIEELAPYAAVLEGFEQPVVITRLMVYGPVDGAMVALDDEPPREAPLSLDVAPGSHRVEMTAPGYHPAVRTVDVPEGVTVPLEIRLDERAAVLLVRGPSGSDLLLDGQRVAELPLRAAISLPAGPHQLAVTRAGRVPFVRSLELGRGEAADLEVELPRTSQRKAAFVALGLGGAGATAAATLAGLALRRQARGRAIAEERLTMGIDEQRYAEGRAAWQQRDELRTAAVATGVVGGLLLTTGAILWLTDRPRLADRLDRPAGGRPLTAAPSLWRGSAGAAFTGRF